MIKIITSISNKLFDRKISWLANKKEYQHARYLLHQRNKTKQDDLWLLSYLAILYQWEGEVDQVISIACQIENFPYSNDTEYARARWSVSRILFHMGLCEEALGLLSFCVDFWPDNVRVLDLKGSLELAQKQYSNAMDTFKRILALDDRNHEAVIAMVDLYWELGEGDRAYEFIKGYLDNYPDFALAHYIMGNLVYNVQGDPRASLPFFEKALYLNPNTRFNRPINNHHIKPHIYEKVIGWYINALLDCGLNKAAEAMIQDINSSESYSSFRSHYYSHIRDWDSAIKWAKRGLKKSPEFHNLRFSLGELYIKVGLYKDAERELLEALKVAEKNYDVTSERIAAFVVLYQLLGKQEKEKEYLTRSLDLDAERTYLILANFYNDLENWDEALFAAEKAIELDPEWIFAVEELARAQLGSGMNLEAIDTYQNLLLKQPNNGKLWLGVAQGYTNLGDEEKAINAVRKAIETKNLSSILFSEAVELSQKLESTSNSRDKKPG